MSKATLAPPAIWAIGAIGLGLIAWTGLFGSWRRVSEGMDPDGRLRRRCSGAVRVGGHDPRNLADLEAAVVRICNAALGRDGDPTAKASRLGNCLLIESSNQALQRYAGMLIRAIDGIEITTAEHFGITSIHGGGGGAMAMGGSLGLGAGGNPFSPEASLGRDGPRSRAP